MSLSKELNRQSVMRYRERMRVMGLRPVQIWVPDTRRPGFEKECRRQSRLIIESDKDDIGLQTLLNEALEDINGWTE